MRTLRKQIYIPESVFNGSTAVGSMVRIPKGRTGLEQILGWIQHEVFSCLDKAEAELPDSLRVEWNPTLIPQHSYGLCRARDLVVRLTCSQFGMQNVFGGRTCELRLSCGLHERLPG